MGLFGKKNQADKAEETCCCCGCDCEGAEKQETGARIKILGGGCRSATRWRRRSGRPASARQERPIEHVTDYAEMAKYGVMSTPALVVDGKVVSCGKVLKADEVVKFLDAAN